MALVRAASSSGLRPWKYTAIRKAAIWASVMVSFTTAVTKASISSVERGRPLRLCKITSMG